MWLQDRDRQRSIRPRAGPLFAINCKVSDGMEVGVKRPPGLRLIRVLRARIIVVNGGSLDGRDGHSTPARRIQALALHKQEEVARNRQAVAGRHKPFAV